MGKVWRGRVSPADFKDLRMRRDKTPEREGL